MGYRIAQIFNQSGIQVIQAEYGYLKKAVDNFTPSFYSVDKVI